MAKQLPQRLDTLVLRFLVIVRLRYVRPRSKTTTETGTRVPRDDVYYRHSCVTACSAELETVLTHSKPLMSKMCAVAVVRRYAAVGRDESGPWAGTPQMPESEFSARIYAGRCVIYICCCHHNPTVSWAQLQYTQAFPFAFLIGFMVGFVSGIGFGSFIGLHAPFSTFAQNC